MAAKKIEDIMMKKIITVKGSATLQEISKILIDNTLSGAPVVDSGGLLTGFVSERDIIASIASGEFADKRVRDIMTKKVIAISSDSTIENASQIFGKYPYRYIPVCKNKRIVGLISRKDVIEKLLGQYY